MDIEEFRITIAKQTLSRELSAMGYRKLSARPRHYTQAEGVIEDLKKTSQRACLSLTRIKSRSQTLSGINLREGPTPHREYVQGDC